MMDRADDIARWIVSVGLDELDQAELIAGYCERLVEAGVPIWRASIGANTLHPLIVAQGHRWLAGKGVREEFFPRASTPEGEEQWLRSPWRWMIEGGEQWMRRRLVVGEGTNECTRLVELAAPGATDYWTRIIPFGDRGRTPEGRGLATSWTTRDPAGFAEADLALIDATLPALGLAFKATMAIETTRTLVTTYLGHN